MEEEKKNKRKATILMIVGVITLIGLVVGATYAYFSAQVGTGDKAQINAKAGTTDDLTFATTGPITITANQTNFAQGENSLYSSATATAHLIAGDDDNTATEHYYLYLQIDANNLTYTVGKDQPELIMEITDPNEQPYTEPIEGLEYKENITDGKGVTYSGYDITEAKGLFAIAKNYEITASNDKTDTWTIKVTFLNLSTDQHENTDKTLTGQLIIQKEMIPESLADTCIGEILSDCIKENYQYDGNIIYHNGSIIASSTITDIEDDSVIGGYKITTEHADKYQKVSINSSSEDLQETHLIKFMCNNKEKYSGSYCSPSLSKYYTLDYAPEKQYDTYKKALQQAINDKYVEIDSSYKLDANDDSYRFSGADEDVKNYVCLDSKTTGECETNDDLYRIIGLFKNNQDEYEMKLIKASAGTTTQLGDNETAEGGAYSSGTSYYWDKSNGTTSENVNMWAESNLNKVNLNNYFYNYITTKATYLENHITEHTWTTGGTSNYGDPKAVYDVELGEGKVKVGDEVCYTQGNKSTARECTEEDLEYTAHIGLMYISDYMYGARPSSWTTSTLSYSKVTSNNWLYSGMHEWTISRLSSSDDIAWEVRSLGQVSNSNVISKDTVRPSFYLTSDAKINEGEGSKTKPYRITFE